MTTYPKATAIALESSIEYAQGAIISKQVTKNSVGNITLFAFDKGQGLTEHTADYDAFVQILDVSTATLINSVKAIASLCLPKYHTLCGLPRVSRCC